MRDRLIELIRKEVMDYASWITEMTLQGSHNMPSIEEVIADKILADGWMRPPLMVGQKVFGFGREMEITEITIHLDRYNSPFYKFEAHYEMNNGIYSFFFIEEDIGKEIFLTREEAEQALKEGGKE